MQLSLDQLEILDAIVVAGSFAGASRALHRAQSAISYNVRELERRLSVTLFDRRGHRAQLTAAGRAILDEGRFLLARARRIEALAQQFQEGCEPALEIVIDGALPMPRVLGVLKSLAREGNATSIQIKVEFLGGVQFRFEKDQADMMLVKDFEPKRGLLARPFAQIECVLCATPEHPLALLGRELTLEDLYEYVELSVHDSSDSPRPDRHRFGGVRVFHLSDFYTKKAAIGMGLGFGWMPLSMVDAELRAGTIAELPYADGSRYQFTSYLVYREHRPLGPTAVKFLELLQAHLETSMALIRDRNSLE